MLIAQVLDLLFVHPEVVDELMQDGEADLPTELGAGRELPTEWFLQDIRD